MTHRTTRDGTEIYYKDWGTGRPVVMIHGWPLNADAWDPQAMALAEAGFRVIAYDRRGFGRSAQPWTGYTYDVPADDLADVMERTGVSDDAALVGFSMAGGEVARDVSRHGGRNVSRAVLISSVVPDMLRTPDNPDGTPQSTFDAIAEGLTRDRAHFLRRTIAPQFFGAGLLTSPVSDEVMADATHEAMMAGLKPTLDCAVAFATTDFRPDLPAFEVPTLIIHGTGDETVPIDAAGRAAHRGIAGSTLTEYEGEPHGLNVTRSDRLTEDLLAFSRRWGRPDRRRRPGTRRAGKEGRPRRDVRSGAAMPPADAADRPGRSLPPGHRRETEAPCRGNMRGIALGR